MPEFPHLPLPKKAHGSYNYPSGGSSKKKSEVTLDNLKNRKKHAQTLTAQANKILEDWNNKQEEVSKLPQPGITPIFLHLDTDLFDLESLTSLGIEIVSEEDDGFIIGASGDYFKSLKEKIYAFAKNKGLYKSKAAQLWEIITGYKWRLDYIISEELNAKWDEINDDEEFIVDVSLACMLKFPAEPKRYKNEREKTFGFRYKRWQGEVRRIEDQRYKLELKRQDDFDNYIQSLSGKRVSDFVNFEDSFSCRLSLLGSALKEMVLYYQYLFDVTEFDDITYLDVETGEEVKADVKFNPPLEDAPSICIVDSGIQEGHRMLTASIKKNASKSYLINNTDVSDQVSNGGHGTKVAGAALFGRIVPKEGTYNLDIWIENAKVLDSGGCMPSSLYPPQLMQEIVNEFHSTHIFNLSINSFRCCKLRHMSEWACAIDKLMYERDILFIVSTGNINKTNGSANNPGIQEYINSQKDYPYYLLENACRIANPAQSCFAISVGSICHDEFEDLDRASFGKMNEISSFSRCGLGLWGMIKPDVVEYGGDYIREKQGNMLISENSSVGVEVIRSTNDGSSGMGFHVGTSYAAPKVSHIAAKVYKSIENASALMVRTLIVQSARLPEQCFYQPTLNDIRKFGYGLPDLTRATQNYETRITLTGEGKIAPKTAQIYTLKIPEEISRPGNDFDILVEVTVSFVSSPRRTRRKTKSYLATWLDWRSSRIGESSSAFQRRIIKYIDGDGNQDDDQGENVFQWKIRENPQWGTVKDCKRQDSSLQKDWAIIPAYNLPNEFSIGVIGHQGWDKDVTNEISYAIAVSFEILNSEVPLNIYSLVETENKILLQTEVQV